MNGILLRLAAPLMAFGEHAAFRYRDTVAFPTRSALIGLFAAADGRPREQALTPDPATGTVPYADLRFTVRIDRPGHRHTDYHTAGGGRPHKQGLSTSSGNYRSQKASTFISHRVYLADAVFTVAVQGPDPLLEKITSRLEQPAFAPYLGRRACAPDEPLVLRGPHPDPVHELLTRAPLSLPAPPRPEQDTVPADFVWEHPPVHTPAANVHRELADVPVDFTPTRRFHHTRRVWRTTEQLPATLYAAQPTINALAAYIQQDTPR
ncbi:MULTISPECIES: type I-E CRISPR-associated protein Cas5/CasD [unclassified Streptomyces]|uniref:type I-E CRISPR-associated protein Cas5/CasD n=1 Tax=unclassified Streptomyces TaxID=2593676 RepID=UPI002E8233E6|nr:type I-E CRISPR-associated protein Cas5/CasD [Streptomyces sp. NBC_00589]WTI33541.1 type I-E CRISPR-associated protein Cas5/CasD [Streptomyces sp. NBC_00775]WTI42386.1 type I-E CRISPR-associated protein Cas5/CasD [Streptomyces sp. NBC_00775]WUB23932.1 type I-E CRISPR-associated protein Cas5/CasD [Streptomyces sp. NBC_00589]WUB32787.1 type I-E CRISPR-associated protein Cas5/CasD [Streptomyces sp. NBC_00589]